MVWKADFIAKTIPCSSAALAFGVVNAAIMPTKRLSVGSVGWHRVSFLHLSITTTIFTWYAPGPSRTFASACVKTATMQ